MKKLESLFDPKNASFNIAYIDVSTGLPVKLESYGANNKWEETYLYFFDRINDPTGDIFKEIKKESK
ncbi:hypothetical protein EEL32_06795 [Brevibacillus laterosporus]|nr:hypothetical protein [Brevibacillus laterosporus]TPG69346.1 hypothetical protein EEL31_13010 [Brevibacillus laterosporus]TPG89165.1 hypothetical protein EEL32_06795 [Brevibacillus laterosporus]